MTMVEEAFSLPTTACQPSANHLLLLSLLLKMMHMHDVTILNLIGQAGDSKRRRSFALSLTVESLHCLVGLKQTVQGKDLLLALKSTLSGT